VANALIGNDNGPEVTNDGLFATIVVQGSNLVQGGLTGFSNVLSGDPLLGPLQSNGGSTPTMALLPGSPAVDAGSNSSALDSSGSSLTTDQDGFARQSGAAVDLGAYEMQPVSITTATLSDGAYGTFYDQGIAATQAENQPSWGPFTFAVTNGTLPTGL